MEEVVAGQVFKGRRTSLRAGSASQVFAGSRTASEDKEAGHGPEGSGSVGHAFKTHLPHKSSISLRPTPDKSWTTVHPGPPGRIPCSGVANGFQDRLGPVSLPGAIRSVCSPTWSFVSLRNSEIPIVSPPITDPIRTHFAVSSEISPRPGQSRLSGRRCAARR
jgi:hypothetical protein